MANPTFPEPGLSAAAVVAAALVQAGDAAQRKPRACLLLVDHLLVADPQRPLAHRKVEAAAEAEAARLPLCPPKDYRWLRSRTSARAFRDVCPP